MAIKYEALRTFVTVAKAGELQQAANSLARTPSAVSMTLKQLGDELGNGGGGGLPGVESHERASPGVATSTS